MPLGMTEITSFMREFTLKLFLLLSINISTASVGGKKLRVGINLEKEREKTMKIERETNFIVMLSFTLAHRPCFP